MNSVPTPIPALMRALLPRDIYGDRSQKSHGGKLGKGLSLRVGAKSPFYSFSQMLRTTYISSSVQRTAAVV
jgi:hypothetical protein